MGDIKPGNVEKARFKRAALLSLTLCALTWFLFGDSLKHLSLNTHSLFSREVSTPIASGASEHSSSAVEGSIAGSDVIVKTNSNKPSSKDGTTLEYDPERIFKQIINTSPAVLFVRSSEYDSTVLRKLLTTDYEITPELLIVDMDMHRNGLLLEQYILDNKIKPSKNSDVLLQSTTAIPKNLKAPYLFVNGVSLINTNIGEDVLKLHSKNQFLTKLKAYAGENVVFHKRDLPSNS